MMYDLLNGRRPESSDYLPIILSSQNLSNLAWAFVYMHHRDESVLKLMAEKVNYPNPSRALNTRSAIVSSH